MNNYDPDEGLIIATVGLILIGVLLLTRWLLGPMWSVLIVATPFCLAIAAAWIGKLTGRL